MPRKDRPKAEPQTRIGPQGEFATCGAHKKDGAGLCRNPAGMGTDHLGYGTCKYHMGCTPAVARGAHRALLADKVDEMKRLGVVPANANPEEVLLQEVARAAGAVAYFDDLVAALEEDELLSPRGIVLTEMWNEQRRLLAQTAKSVVQAGLAKRTVQVQETQAALLVQIVLAVIGSPELSLDSEQQSIARRLVASQLRALPTAVLDTTAA